MKIRNISDIQICEPEITVSITLDIQSQSPETAFRRNLKKKNKILEPFMTAGDYAAEAMSKSPRHINSDQLVRELREGNREALKTLIQKFHPKMIRCIQYYTKAPELAEDIAQECWYSILENLDEVGLKISFEAWVLTIAKHKSIDWIRKQQRIRKQDQKVKIEFGAEAETEREPYNEIEIKFQSVHIGIEQLPPTQKIVLKMFYLENLSLQEISETLQISTGTAKSRLFYARENLKKIISTLKHDQL